MKCSILKVGIRCNPDKKSPDRAKRQHRTFAMPGIEPCVAATFSNRVSGGDFGGSSCPTRLQTRLHMPTRLCGNRAALLDSIVPGADNLQV